MALIVCKKCGKQISDKAKTCPYCGEIIKEELSSTESVKKCEECGAEIPTGADSCPTCGCPIENVEKETNIEDKITTSQKKKWLIPLISHLFAPSFSSNLHFFAPTFSSKLHLFALTF